jgi:hypothetical protein
MNGDIHEHLVMFMNIKMEIFAFMLISVMFLRNHSLFPATFNHEYHVYKKSRPWSLRRDV